MNEASPRPAHWPHLARSFGLHPPRVAGDVARATMTMPDGTECEAPLDDLRASLLLLELTRFLYLAAEKRSR